MANLNVAVILSGCGYLDGAEINEVVLTLLSLEKRGVNYQCFAPDIEQYHVVNHLTGEQTSEKRNVLIESARIVRGKVKPITECDSSNFGALIVPGGFGVAKNLSTFAFEGSNFKLQPDLLKICQSFIGKAVGYICIGPALLPIIYEKNIKLTIGNDKDTNDIIKSLGGSPVNCGVADVVVDNENKIVSTPAYMLANNINEAHQGIDKLVEKTLALAEHK
ncbi:Enhancing lycopene biosynthesis protein 2 [Arsenophonus endosymbiont of Aleurodicus floccissimus]|uniref:isoprenoid biosynthesis glyoxalase ElbB n=1 Tax=Arsenophonus endosymbiont of Aleurodicus floccissimus TaxID=2152761 RepID=UPI000E6B3DF2|nr:isoprenoid biosynthesis glyoxalase ElbB [Arsenophonus endosymbiont of Aleurodicus floccissimus]SPP32644.1 Enhancing lycopene biosynthesis protein 2 [Arsenophonus endosymbiont of Aleurodicus floccissimus]